MANFISDEEMAKLESSQAPSSGKIISDEEMSKMEANQPTEFDSGVRGAVQGATMGFADEISGGVEALWNKAKGDPTTFGELYKAKRDESRANFKTAEEANPKSYMTGQVGGAIATAAIPGMGGASIGKLALQGAAHGLGNSQADLTEGDVAGALKDTAIGAGTGAAIGGAGKLIAKAAPKVMQGVQHTSEEVATNPMLEKAIDATNLTGKAKGMVDSVMKKVGSDLRLDSSVADVVIGVIGRKATYSNPLTGAVQGLSDTGRVISKGAMMTAENLPKNIDKMGKFAPVMMDAAQRGGTSLAATSFVLEQTNPEYRAIKRKAQGLDDE